MNVGYWHTDYFNDEYWNPLYWVLYTTSALAVLDAEDAGTTPFQFDSVVSDPVNSVTESTVWKAGGSYSYLFTHTSGLLAQNYGVKAFTPSDTLYLRFTLFYTAATWNPGAYWQILNLYDDGASPPVQLILVRQGDGTFGYSVYVNEGNETEDEVISHAGESKIPSGVATEIELLYRRSATGGGAAVWINGVQDGANFTRDTSGYNAIQALHIGNNTSPSPGADGDYFYLDDIEADAVGLAVDTGGGRNWDDRRRRQRLAAHIMLVGRV